MQFKFCNGESPRQLGLRVHITMTCQANRDQIVELVGAINHLFYDVVDLQMERFEAATDAAVSRALRENFVRSLLWNSHILIMVSEIIQVKPT